MPTTNPFDQFDDVKPKIESNPFDAFDDPKDAPDNKKELSPGEYVQQAIANIPQSAFKALSDTASAVAHPGETIAGLFGLAIGTIEKIIPGGKDQNVKYPDAAMKHLRERYGSIDNLKKTIREDPVGAVLDLSTVLLPVGGGLQKLGKLSKINAVEDFGKVASVVSDVLDPAILAGKVVTSKTVRGLTPDVIKKVIPASKKQLTAEVFDINPKMKRADELVDLSIKEGILPNKAGRKKVTDSIDEYSEILNESVDTFTGTITEKAKQNPDFQKLSPSGQKQLLDEKTTIPVSRIEDKMNKFKDQQISKSDKKIVENMMDDYHIPHKSLTTSEGRAYLNKLTEKLNDPKNLTGGLDRRVIEELRDGIIGEMERLMPQVKKMKGEFIDPLTEMKNLIDKKLNLTGLDLAPFAKDIAQITSSAALSGRIRVTDILTLAGKLVPDLRNNMLGIVSKLESKGIPINSKTYINIAKVTRLLENTGQATGISEEVKENVESKDSK